MSAVRRSADTCRRILSEQTISADGPGSIGCDIEALIEFIGERWLATKARTGNLPAESLPELNARLAAPIALALKRPLLRDYPNIAGPYVLLRVMGLVQQGGSRVAINAEMLTKWRSLNAVEKYFALLEAWLFRAEAAVLGGEVRRGWRQDQFVANLRFLDVLANTRWKHFEDYCHSVDVTGAVSAWNTQLHLRFGLVEVRSRPLVAPDGRLRQAGRGWTMEQARRTPWGQAVAWALHASVARDGEDDMIWLHGLPEGAGFGFLQPTFQPFFPAWEKTFGLAHATARPGTYVFKVTLTDRRADGDVWRRLAVPGTAALAGLADGVLQAFDFSDTQHLYELRFRDRLGRRRVYNHYECDEGPYADEIAVGELELPERAEIEFRFDYGDDWRFLLQLERVEPPGRAKVQITLRESVGKAPEQYP